MAATDDTTNIYEVIVIGAGIMGSATAYYLTKHYGPNRVLLLEQFDWLHRRGSSHGESRIIRRTYVQDRYTCLMEDAYKLWLDAEAEAGTKVYTKTGGIDFVSVNSPSKDGIIAAAQKHNIPLTVMNAEETKAKFPTIHMPAGQLALYSPDAGILNATKSVSMFQTLTKLGGGQLLDNMPVIDIENTGTGGLAPAPLKITTQNGTILYSQKCVVTAGPWTLKLMKACFNVDLSLEPRQTQVAYWQVSEAHAAEYSSQKFPVFINYDEPAVYGGPAHEYPTMIKCAGYYDRGHCDPDTRTFIPDMEPLLNGANAFIQSHFVGVETKPTLVETCLTTDSPDGDFILDRLPGNPNIIVGCGFSGHGFKLGPVVGKILAQLAIDGKFLYPEIESYFTLSRLDQK